MRTKLIAIIILSTGIVAATVGYFVFTQPAPTTQLQEAFTGNGSVVCQTENSISKKTWHLQQGKFFIETTYIGTDPQLIDYDLYDKTNLYLWNNRVKTGSITANADTKNGVYEYLSSIDSFNTEMERSNTKVSCKNEDTYSFEPPSDVTFSGEIKYYSNEQEYNNSTN